MFWCPVAQGLSCITRIGMALRVVGGGGEAVSLDV